MPLSELKPHLFTDAQNPTGFLPNFLLQGKLGFCLTHNQMLNLKEEEYEVCIDSPLQTGI